ncbi:MULTISPECIES: dynamin family protein [unclassified Helicobacter]|uniref:dynamin family protein n=1 Tax=unclassified Helicobacter TaxID=2593540 RepID=UPI00115FAC92|nr:MULTISPECIES: dynamin family protein [unclassified Helicobacter]
MSDDMNDLTSKIDSGRIDSASEARHADARASGDKSETNELSAPKAQITQIAIKQALLMDFARIAYPIESSIDSSLQCLESMAANALDSALDSGAEGDFGDVDSSDMDSALESKNAESSALDSAPANIEALAILLSFGEQNCERYISTSIFADILKRGANARESKKTESATRESKKPESKKADSIDSGALFISKSDAAPTMREALIMQFALLARATPSTLKSAKAKLMRLNAAGIITSTRTRALLNLFDTHNATLEKLSADKKMQKSANLSQDTLRHELKNITNIIKKAAPDSAKSLESILENLAHNRFSIGVAGVLSAGKSTFLNALLGQEILGTSTIPETANLTILKYAKEPYAEIYFWSEEEWRQLESTQNARQNAGGENADSAPESIPESSALENLDSAPESTAPKNAESAPTSNPDSPLALIRTGKKRINIDELSRYTSANHQSRLCDLVEKVELFTPLAFLQNGVEIVDTPGLDDPVIKREEITRSYMRACDLLIYVMNASCAATQKDMDFILQTLMSGHISRLLVVLTRADLLESRELESSLSYTKSSLAKELQKLHYEGDIDALLSRIDLIAVSGIYALAYKTQDSAMMQKAQDAGFSLEKTGIPQVESYLESMLLGSESQKQKDMLYSAYRHTSSIIKGALEALALERGIFEADEGEKERILRSLNATHEALLDSQNALESRLNSAQDEFARYLSGLGSIIDAHLRAHLSRLHTQIYDDAVYEYARGASPSSERINAITTQSLADSLSDLMREYQYKLTQKLLNLSALLEADIARIETMGALDSDALGALKIELPSISSANAKIKACASELGEAIYKLTTGYSKSTQEVLRGALESKIFAYIDTINAIIAQENASIESSLCQTFDAYRSAYKKALQEKMNHSKQTLQNALERAKGANKERILAENLAAQKILKTTQNEVQIIIEALA